MNVLKTYLKTTMKNLLNIFTCLFSLALGTHSASVSTLYEFPSGTWVENIAVRSNGNLLVVLYSEPSVYEINPFESPATATLVAHFAGFTGIQGIVETTPDVFAVMPFASGKYSLWTFDLSLGTQNEIIAMVPGAGLLNGLTKLSDTILMASDMKYGAVVRFDLTTSSSAVTIKDDTMAGLPLNIGVGINGIRARNNTLYYNNSAKASSAVLMSTPVAGTAIDKAQIIAGGLGFIDDLALGAEDGDSAYLAQYLGGKVVEVRSDGSIEEVASGLNFPTSAAFGRTQSDSRTVVCYYFWISTVYVCEGSVCWREGLCCRS